MQPDRLRQGALALMLAALAGCGGVDTRAPSEDSDASSHAQMSSKGQANLSLARNYLANDQVELALDRANRALRSDPESSDVQIVLGMIREEIGELDRAGANYERAAKLSPESGHVLNVYGVWLCKQGKPAEADAVFARALDDPFYKARDQALFNAAKCALQAGELDKAGAYGRLALQTAPENPAVLVLMADVQFQRRDYFSARAFVQRREALGNASPEFLSLAARIEMAAGDAAAAQRYQTRLREEFPDFTPPATEGSRQP
jgi:type IV pilus assembly protein PilF